MGRVNPFFERAGFVKVGTIRKDALPGERYGAYGGRHRVRPETIAQSRHSEPVYYVFDNRSRTYLPPLAALV